nr:FAD-dependent oxidoreductase [Halomonas socia]
MKVDVRNQPDVLVVGGGAAGIAASFAAAREGSTVLLVEQFGSLGGTASTTTLGSICGLFTVDGEAVKPVVEGFAKTFLALLRDKYDGAGDPVRWLQTASVPYNPFLLSVAADDVLEQAGVDVLLHASAIDIVHDRDTKNIDSVLFSSHSGIWAVRPKLVIDCTGDGDIAAHAGVGFDLELDSLQFPTAMFECTGVDLDTVRKNTRDTVRQSLERAADDGHPLPRLSAGIFPTDRATAHINATRIQNLVTKKAPNPLDVEEISSAERAGRRQVLDYIQAFRQHMPGFSDARISHAGATLGIRESRRIHGLYTLSDEDVLGASRFEDVVACSAWPVEDHDSSGKTKWVWMEPGQYYQIPYRVLVPQKVNNLLVAGRCVSATHTAQASLRVVAVSMALGEAAGTAAAHCVDSGVTPAEVNVERLQNRLKYHGAFLGDEA